MPCLLFFVAFPPSLPARFSPSASIFLCFRVVLVFESARHHFAHHYTGPSTPPSPLPTRPSPQARSSIIAGLRGAHPAAPPHPFPVTVALLTEALQMLATAEAHAYAGAAQNRAAEKSADQNSAAWIGAAQDSAAQNSAAQISATHPGAGPDTAGGAPRDHRRTCLYCAMAVGATAAGACDSAAPAHQAAGGGADLGPISVDLGPISATTDAAAAMLGWARLAAGAPIPPGGDCAGRSGATPPSPPPVQVTLLRFRPGETLSSPGRDERPRCPPAAWGGAVDVAWLSAFPREREWLFPPLTRIAPIGRSVTITIGATPQTGDTPLPEGFGAPVPVGGDAAITEGGLQAGDAPVPEGGLRVRVVDVAAIVCLDAGLEAREWRPRPAISFSV